MGRDGHEDELGISSKRELAERILDRVLALRTKAREHAVVAGA